MLLSTESYDAAFKQIKNDAIGAGCTVIVFVATTADSLCACKILTALLRTDDISYKIKPVNGYRDLARGIDEYVKDNDEFRSIGKIEMVYFSVSLSTSTIILHIIVVLLALRILAPLKL